MTDESDERFHEIIRKMTEQEIGEERPAGRGYGFDDPRRFERWAAQDAEKSQQARPKPGAPVTDWAANEAWFDRKINAVIEVTVGDAIEQIANKIADQFDRECAARERLEDRVRELLLEQSKMATTVAKLEIALAQLELRQATGDRRVIDQQPSLKSVN